MAFNATLINKNYQKITGSVGSRVYTGGNFGFDPRSIPKTMLYLDASYPSNVIRDSANNVTQWNDLSVKSLQTSPQYSVTGILNSNPTYLNKGINFSGTRYLTGSVSAVGDLATDDFAIFVVVKVPSTTTDQYILSKYSSANLHWELYFNRSDNVVFSYTYGSGLSKTVTSVGVTAGETIVIAVIAPRKMPLGMNIYINGVGGPTPVTGISTTITTASNLYIGVNHTTTYANYLISSINEILIYRSSGTTSTTTTTIMSRNQQQQIEGYLAWKWGLRSKLSLGSNIPILGFTLTSNTFTLSAAKAMTDNAGVIFYDLPTGVAATLYYVLNATTSTSKNFQLTATNSGTTALSPTFSITELPCDAWYGTTYIKITGYSTSTNRLILAQPGLGFNQDDIFVISNNVAGLTAGITYKAGASNSSQDDVLYVANMGGNIITLTGASTFTAYLIKAPTAITINSWTGANSKNAFFSTTDVVQGQSIVFPTNYAGLTANYPYYVYENSNADQTFHIYDDLYYTISTLSGTTSSTTALIESSMYNNSLTSPVKLYLSKPFLRSFLPNDIPNCMLWLDGADKSSIVLSAGSNTVTTWYDKSGSGNHATAYSFNYHRFNSAAHATTALPTYDPTPTDPSTNGILFSTGNNYFNDKLPGGDVTLDTTALQTNLSSILSTETTFVVINFTNFLTRQYNNTILSSSILGSKTYSGSYPNESNNVVKITRTLHAITASTNSSLSSLQIATDDLSNAPAKVIVNGNSYKGNVYILGLTRSGTVSTVRRNGVSATSAQEPYTATSGTTVIGMDQPLATTGSYQPGSCYYGNYTGLDAYVLEIITYNSLLTSSQFQQVEGYFAWKWGLPDPNTPIGSGLQTLLPNTHPFTEFPSATTVPY